MKILLRYFSVFLIASFYLLLATPTTHALEPFPPFSKEGNPPEAYYYGDIFPLFHYITPASFQIYENLNLTRNYEDFAVCKYDGFDRRDYDCSLIVNNDTGGTSELDGCDGGDVDVCYRDSGGKAYTAHSGKTSCKPAVSRDQRIEGATIPGKCEYTQTPRITRTIKGTDFSKDASSLNDATGNQDGTNPFSNYNYPKLQTGWQLFGNVGSDNALTWGSHYLGFSTCDQAVLQLSVLTKARQTKETVTSSGGQWPLGWVDWGYTTVNGKTLLEIYENLPSGLKSAGKVIVEGTDDFFMNAGNLDAVSDTGKEKKYVCDTVNGALQTSSPPTWLSDMLQSPLYPPSFRQGYARASICVWNTCCPGPRCPNKDEDLEGNSRALYPDINISRDYNAALQEFLASYPLQDASKVFQKMSESNQLIRFAGSAASNATPPEIIKRLDKEITDDCVKYRFRGWLGFAGMVDYVNPGDFLDPGQKCPSYHILSGFDKEKGGSFPTSILQRVIDLIWTTLGGEKLDEIIPRFYHLITIPDAMGQSISVITGQSYNTRDTLLDLKGAEDHNNNLSNIVDDEADYLFAGESMIVGDSQRRLAHFTCADPYFSSQLETGIEAYALGTRIGCENKALAPGVCDGKLFGEILANNPGNYPIEVAGSTDSYIVNNILPKFTPELLKTYALAEQETGVPCEVLAGHHFEEASQFFTSGDPSKRSVANGQPLEPGQSLEDTALIAANGLLRHPIDSVPHLVTAISNFNGGGNSNCQSGFPAPIPYGGCPRLFQGDDDPYATNMLDSRHTNMYLLYCGDFTPCLPPVPYGNDRPGAYAVALSLYNNVTKNGNSTFADASPVAIPNPGTPSGEPLTKFTPETCGENTIATALGCLPYDQRLTGVLLSFTAGISGAIALVIMFMGIFQIMTAGGDPQKLQKGKELFTSAIIGLLVVIFSVTLLKIIAGDIIQLPGF